MHIFNTTGVPIYCWGRDMLENTAMVQAFDIARTMPIYDHLALMPDAHMGMGMPIGGVMPLINAICPNAVGVDIGCGMLAVQTSLTSIDIEDQKNIFSFIRGAVPVGFHKHDKPREWEGFAKAPINIPLIEEELDNARLSLGTLGGGNHFIEFQKGSDGFIWFMIHSGSRNFGYKICNYYNKLAKEKGKTVLENMSYFELDTPEAKEYIVAMNYALKFAYANRQEMARSIQRGIIAVLGSNIEFEEINIHHNYAKIVMMLDDWSSSIVIHRKGATLATKDTTGIIPGSQGTSSYIVKGKGNLDSFASCSHGAGRTMSRTAATGLTRKGKRKFEAGISVSEAEKAMGDLLCRFTERNVDEAPQAYKDIEQVMKAQEDLVEILVELKPYQIAAIKG